MSFPCLTSLFCFQQAKREAILKKLEERDVKIRETRVRSANVEMGGMIKLTGSLYYSCSSKTSTSYLAENHRAHSVANLRRTDGARSASCDRHGIFFYNFYLSIEH